MGGKDNPMDIWAEKAAEDTKIRQPQSGLLCRMSKGSQETKKDYGILKGVSL